LTNYAGLNHERIERRVGESSIRGRKQDLHKILLCCWAGQTRENVVYLICEIRHKQRVLDSNKLSLRTPLLVKANYYVPFYLRHNALIVELFLIIIIANL
jgi:hypothetical protein